MTSQNGASSPEAAQAWRTDDFDYPLPDALIARHPLERRAGARLLHAQVHGQRLVHRQVEALPALLRPGDVMVFNDARVFRARLVGQKRATGGKAELLLVRPVGSESAEALARPLDGQVWTALGQAGKGFKVGQVVGLQSGDDALEAEVLELLGEGELHVRFRSASTRSALEQLDALGALPLPPYVARAPTPDDDVRYQTVFARTNGSVAAPTAGLHFDEALLGLLDAAGIQRCALTLDVGPGTFLPVRSDTLAEHRMHRERAHLPDATVQHLEAARREGRRIVAVGTTVVRALEGCVALKGRLEAGAFDTSLFVLPGHRFRAVDVLMTNFHLPRSTLLMLVSAFMGVGFARAAYREAVAHGYRFFSYGDAMLIEAGT